MVALLRRRRAAGGEPGRRCSARSLGVAAQRRGATSSRSSPRPAIGDLGAWLEQLIAESTGKQGKGLIPVDREPLGPPDGLRRRPLLRLPAARRRRRRRSRTRRCAALERGGPAGRPHRRSTTSSDSAQEFFRWEIATAVAGAVIGINPFDQPDVEASKIETREADRRVRGRPARCPPETPLFEDDGRRALRRPEERRRAARRRPTASRRRPRGAPRPAERRRLPRAPRLRRAERRRIERRCSAIRGIACATRSRVATCLGFGPRFLHSTGQAYKGGPNTGVFLQITARSTQRPGDPGPASYTFGTVKAAQARGDFEVLAERGRRALRVHLKGGDVGRA